MLVYSLYLIWIIIVFAFFREVHKDTDEEASDLFLWLGIIGFNCFLTLIPGYIYGLTIIQSFWFGLIFWSSIAILAHPKIPYRKILKLIVSFTTICIKEFLEMTYEGLQNIQEKRRKSKILREEEKIRKEKIIRAFEKNLRRGKFIKLITYENYEKRYCNTLNIIGEPTPVKVKNAYVDFYNKFLKGEKVKIDQINEAYDFFKRKFRLK